MSSARLARRAVSSALATARERVVTFASPAPRTVTSSAPPPPPLPCWSCDADQVTVRPGAAYVFFCAACGAIQPAPSSSGVDYFQLLGVRQKFDVDASTLEDAMKARQKMLHPDKFSTKSEMERAYSADQASAVNEAYGVLRDPLKRAQYILDARGWGVTERDGRDRPVDSELLMEVMEAREAISEASGDGERLRSMLREYGKKVSDCIESTRKALDAQPMDGEKAKDEVVRLTYFVRIVDELKSLM